MAKAKKLPSGNWRVQASVTINGIIMRRSFTESSAKKAEDAANEWKSHCKMIGSDSTRMTVKEAITAYVEMSENELSPSTIREYVRISNKGLQDIIDKPLYTLTCPVIKASMNKALETLSPKTIKNRYALLQRVLSVYYPSFIWAIEYPKQKKKPKRVYSNEYIGQILRAVKDTDFEIETYLGILSMRESEVAGAKWTDIDYKNKTLHVCRTKLLNKNSQYVIVERTKTEESDRLVPLPDYVCKIAYKKSLTAKSEYISTIPPNRYWQHLNAILKRHNIEPLKFHELRHIYSSVTSSLGIDTEIRMANGGWSNEQIMDGRYRHPISEQQKIANKKMNDYINDIAKIHTKIHTKNRKRLKLVRFDQLL